MCSARCRRACHSTGGTSSPSEPALTRRSLLRLRQQWTRLVDMRQVNVHEAKTELFKLLDQIAGGEEVIITRNGEPVARLVPYRATPERRRLGLFEGQGEIHEDFDELPADLAEALGAM